eukprot:8146871-Pyramimonas_sp.AAC.1
MDALSFPPDLAFALLEPQSHCVADFKFQDVEVMGVPWDRCVKTGSVEAPMGWFCETIVMWSDLCHNWR